ncbi:DUF3987 domain-containing protein [Aquitalea sp. LB_tupeE]|uniref:DUF3987 domain-containing protein n=1 Tax=Aquitalea sp. LB_tupeE TaxID=2748078 RepID=UPI0015BB4808|nr:DUF3987 domain-containing protein [Aquitalea sp. LB_tupeE]NWK77226.1 DUF3987 domain-containing protein [Aquitalea sp. LB_tupeE]
MTDLVMKASDEARMAAGRLSAQAKAEGYRAEALHVYTDASGTPLYWRIRAKHDNGDKWIRPMHYDGSQYRIGEPPAPAGGKPLYGLHSLALQPDDAVYLVEGEKAADALLRLGHVAVTSGAADSANVADWTPLAGRSVTIWPDNDEAGTKYLSDCLPLLWATGVAAISIVDVSTLSLPSKGDVVDWLTVHKPAELADLPLIEMETPDTGPEPFERDSEPTPWPADCLPGAMQQAAQAIAEHVQAPEPLAAMAVLAAVAHVAQRIANADHPKMGAMPSSLFVLSLANSGDRKSATFSLATRPIDKAEVEQRQHHRSQTEAIEREAATAKPQERESILQDKPRDPRTIYSEATLEKVVRDFVKGSRPALSWSSDEAGQFFGGHTMKSDTMMAALGTLTRLFDGKGVERDRVGAESGSGFRPNVRFGLFLSGQPSVIASSLANPMLRGQGLLPRFILSCPASMAGERFLDESALEQRTDRDQRLIHYWATLGRMNQYPESLDQYGGLDLPSATLTPDATALWLNFYNATEARQAPLVGDLTGSLQAFGGRAGELAVRVATVFAVWRHFERLDDDLQVLGEDMARACRLVGYSLAEWLRLSETTQLSATERDARDLLAFLQRDTGKWASFTKTAAAQKGYRPLRDDKDRRNAALDELVRRRWLSFDGSRFTLAKDQSQGVAKAKTANSANSWGVAGSEISQISQISLSHPPKPSFSEPVLSSPPPVTTAPPAPELDCQSLDDWNAAYEAADHLLTGTDEVKF